MTSYNNYETVKECIKYIYRGEMSKQKLRRMIGKSMTNDRFNFAYSMYWALYEEQQRKNEYLSKKDIDFTIKDWKTMKPHEKQRYENS